MSEDKKMDSNAPKDRDNIKKTDDVTFANSSRLVIAW